MKLSYFWIIGLAIAINAAAFAQDAPAKDSNTKTKKNYSMTTKNGNPIRTKNGKVVQLKKKKFHKSLG